MEKGTIRGKRRARKFALQALYQWLMAGLELANIETQFRIKKNMEKVDGDYFHDLLYGVVKHLTEIEVTFSPFLNISIETLNPIELTVLRLSTYELLFCPELPYRVILDEAVSLTKSFGSQEGHRFVNGVMNNLARKVRATEIHNT